MAEVAELTEAAVSTPGAESAGTMPGDAPAGPSGSMTPATQNRGMQAAALLSLQQASQIIGNALMVFGAGSDIGKDLLSVQTKLSKYLPATPPSSGTMSAGMRQLMMQQRANGAGGDLQTALRLRPSPMSAPPAGSNGQPLQ